MKLSPAVLTFDAAGTPYSPVYGDIYHSADSGPGQAHHVFVTGNDLPERWAGKRLFTILETGFGLGLNFLAIWMAWRADSARTARLHFVSVEKHPVSRAALVEVHQRYPEFALLAAQLHAAWPLLVPGMHRLHFDGGRVTLTVVFADVADALPEMRLGADAFCLDGFSPERNAEMWTPRLMKALARLARPGATLATYTVARPVRDALAEAGFVVTRRPGFGRKRDMLAARYAPRWQPRHVSPPLPDWPQRRAIVVGAGLAGAAICERLAARGWIIDLVERNSTPAAETSRLHAAAFHPQIARDDGVASRLTRAGFLYSLEHWRALEAAGQRLAWRRCGVLQIAKDPAHEARMALAISELDFPAQYVQLADRAMASVQAGCEMPAGGAWFPQGGWIQPASLVTAQLRAAGISPHFGKAVVALRREGACWQAVAADRSVIASAPVAILANAGEAANFVELAQPLQRIRGQLTHIPERVMPPLRVVLTGRDYLLPAVEGIAVTGASYDLGAGEPASMAAGHAVNLAQIAHLLGGAAGRLDTSTLTGSMGFRCVAPDRMPLIGALPDLAAARVRGADLCGAQAHDLPRLPGLFGAFGYASRGVMWAALGGELIASMIEGEPLPLNGDLIDAVDPARFVLTLARRGGL